MNMMKLKSGISELYTRTIDALTEEEVSSILEQGRKWNLGPTLSKGGVALFPHTLIHTCGDQVASVVQGCLDTGADRVIVLGVVHSLDLTHILGARQRARLGEDVSKESCRGIFGPHFSGDETWKKEYSLHNFCFLWNHEIKRRGIKKPPELILAYTCLVHNEPWTMPGIELLESYLPNSVIVATVDLCHHGKAYFTPPSEVIPLSKEAENFARVTLERGFKIAQEESYAAYLDYCIEAKSDGRDIMQLLMYLKGPLKSRTLDLRLVDVAHLFEGEPSPSWVAAALVEMISI